QHQPLQRWVWVPAFSVGIQWFCILINDAFESVVTPLPICRTVPVLHKILKAKRDTGIEPATSRLGIRRSIVNKEHMRSQACVLSISIHGVSATSEASPA